MSERPPALCFRTFGIKVDTDDLLTPPRPLSWHLPVVLLLATTASSLAAIQSQNPTLSIMI